MIAKPPHYLYLFLFPSHPSYKHCCLSIHYLCTLAFLRFRAALNEQKAKQAVRSFPLQTNKCPLFIYFPVSVRWSVTIVSRTTASHAPAARGNRGPLHEQRYDSLLFRHTTGYNQKCTKNYIKSFVNQWPDLNNQWPDLKGARNTKVRIN